MFDVDYFDAVVIGAGQSGVPLTTALADAGWSTALVEAKHVGGTCVNEGCTPTKTMRASARQAHMTRRAGDYGIETGEVHVDLRQVRQRKREIVESFRKSNLRRIEESGADLIRGVGRFTGERSIAVHLNEGGERRLNADKVFINTGARPRLPDLPGLGEIPFLNSTSIMELTEAPEHLLIIGGGYVGVEFSQMFRRFGSQVSIIQLDGQLLPHEDEDVAEEVAEILQDEGIDIYLNTRPTQVSQREDGGLQLHTKTPESRELINGSHLLVAVGRVPNTQELDLPTAGVELDVSNHVQVNDRLETSAEGVFAMGDVKGGPAFTHISYDDYRVLRANLLEAGERSIDDRLIPYTVFIDPQLGRVGLTESQAREQGLAIKVAKMPMASVSRAIEIAQTRGFLKIVVDSRTDRILGCTILGVQGGELMSMAQIAMMGDLPYQELKNGVFTHPTLAESFNSVFSHFQG